jgi:putative photosynthetic complex assembly protein 2
MLLAFTLIAMVLLSVGEANQFGMWTFATLFAARISAKLNLYLGVRKINVEFIPDHLAHLPSHFRIARMNWLFPISITALSVAAAFWLGHVFAAEVPALAVGYALLGALTALALLEHWFMVLPLPDERLWRWMLPDRPDPTQATLPSEEAR